MNWQERLSFKMNRSSWETAHDDEHPDVKDMNDLQAHLMNHHKGDFIGNVSDHEWFHLDPEDYISANREILRYPIEDHWPDHYHTDDFFYDIHIPNKLPPSFANFKKLSDPTDTLRGEGASAFTEPGYQDDQDEQVVGPQDLDSNATEVDKFPKSVGVFKNSSWKFATSLCPGCPFTESIEDLSNRIAESLEKRDSSQTLESYHTFREEGRPYIGRLSRLHREAAEYHRNVGEDQKADNHLQTARKIGTEYISTNPFDISKENDLREGGKKNNPKTSSWNQRFADSAGGGQFGTPIDYSENRMQSVEAPGLQIRTPLDTGQRPYDEQYRDPNSTLSLRSWFTGYDLNGPWPHTKNLTGPLDFEPTDHSNENSTGPITSSWHQSFVETFDTRPEEPSPDSLLNPSDELKNGRPRSTDLPSQGAQMIPGMLIDHDPMGGSNFGGSSA